MSLDTTIGDLPVDPPAYDTADSDACDSGDGHEDTGVETAFCGFPEDEPAPGGTWTRRALPIVRAVLKELATFEWEGCPGLPFNEMIQCAECKRFQEPRGQMQERGYDRKSGKKLFCWSCA